MPKDTFLNLPPDKRARFAEAAIEEFSERGYTGASISRIVARAKIAKGSFYQYFDGKIVLFRWLLLEETARRKLEYLAAQPEPTVGDYWALLGNMMLGGIRFGLEHPRLSRIAAVLWHPSADPELQSLVSEYQALARTNMRVLLAQGQAVGHVRTDLDLDVAADFLLAQLMQGMDLAIQRRIGMDLIEFCAHPERLREFPEREQRRLIAEHMDLLRHALGPRKPPLRQGRERLLDLEAFLNQSSEED